MSITVAAPNIRTNPRNVVIITVARVREILTEIVEEHPLRRDARLKPDERPRYVEWGHPNNLTAMLLLRLGFGLGVLTALDAEHPVGDLFVPGVLVAESRHPALNRLEPAARDLIAYLQTQQHRGRAWGAIARDAFNLNRFWFPGRDRRTKPWMCAP